MLSGKKRACANISVKLYYIATLHYCTLHYITTFQISREWYLKHVRFYVKVKNMNLTVFYADLCKYCNSLEIKCTMSRA